MVPFTKIKKASFYWFVKGGRGHIYGHVATCSRRTPLSLQAQGGSARSLLQSLLDTT